MANFVTPAQKVAESTVAALRFLSVLPRTVNRDAEAAYEAGFGTTVSVPLPVKATANELSKSQREARTAITYGDLSRQYCPVALDTQIYSAARLPSDWATWTLQDFEKEVVRPQAEAVVDIVPAKLADVMKTVKASQADNPKAAGVVYTDAKALKVKGDGSNVFAVLSRVARVLNVNKVPASDRYIAVGAGISEILHRNKDLLNVSFTADQGDLLHEAIITRLHGFTVVEDVNLPEDFGVAYQRDAFTLALRAADVPQGATYGASVAQDGFSIRHICDYDPNYTEDRSVIDAFFGAAVMDEARATAFGLS